MTHGPARWLARWLVVALAVVGGVVLVGTPAEAALRTAATARNKFVGVALATGPLAGDATYRGLAATEFSQVTPENAMKWDATEPTDNQYSFAGADQVVTFAQQNNQTVHGHTLVWHSQTPGWVTGLNATVLRAAMQDHIATVVGRYAINPVVTSWDVVNEAFNEEGTRRQSFWQTTLGDGYIADAFLLARAADPDARLCLNDFNVEGINAKSTAMFNLVQSLRAQNVPIDCVGFQGHLAVQFGFPNQVQQNIQRFADLGVQVRITELDVRIPLPADDNEIATQNQYYTNVVTACLAVTACAGITIWGLDDGHSWVPQTFPNEGQATLYTASYQPKPAYNAVNTALGGTTDTTPPTVPGTPTVTGTTPGTVSLSWAASTDTGGSGLAGYDVVRAPGASGGTFAQVGQPTGTSFSDTGLTSNAVYRYQVRARDGAGNVSVFTAPVAATTQPGGGGGTCSASPVLQTQWDNGYVIQPVNVTNTSTSTITGWTVVFPLPAGHSIVGFWRASVTVSGQTVTARSLSYNGTVAPGGTETFGFQGSRPGGTTALPSGYTCTSP